MKSVVCIGGFHTDAKAVVAGPVVPGTSNPATVTRGLGGVACNVTRTLVRLGVRVRAAGLIGADDTGRDLLSTLEAEGVDVSGLAPVTGATTAMYTAVLDDAGGLAVGIADMAVYERMDSGWAGSVDLAADIVFADANLTAAALEVIAAGVGGDRLVLDPVSVEKARRVLGAVQGGATMFPDAAEATALSGHDDPAAAAADLVAKGADRVVVTLGADGIVMADSTGVTRVGAIEPDRVLDVTGAGDALVGGYLAAVAYDETDPLGWGLAAASLAVESLATVPDDLDVARLLDRLSQRASA